MGGASSYEWNSGAMRGKGQEEGWGEGEEEVEIKGYHYSQGFGVINQIYQIPLIRSESHTYRGRLTPNLLKFCISLYGVSLLHF